MVMKQRAKCIAKYRSNLLFKLKIIIASNLSILNLDLPMI